MNSWERVMGTLSGRKTDRAPVFAVLGAYAGPRIGAPLRDLYCDAAVYVAGQVALQDAFGFDMVLAPFDFPAIAEAHGGQTTWSEHQAPNVRRSAAQDAQSALALPAPDLATAGRLPVCLEAARQLSDRYREQVPVFGVIPGPGAFPVLLMGLEAWMDTLLFDEPNARRLLDRSCDFFLRWSGLLVDAGVTGLVVPEPMATQELLPRELFIERVEPAVADAFSQARVPLLIHHAGGRILQVLDRLAALPGILGVSVSSRDDLTDCRRILGPEKLLVGNLDNLSFPSLSAQQMHAAALQCLEKTADQGPFILANSGGDIPLETREETLRAMLDASARFSGRGRS